MAWLRLFYHHVVYWIKGTTPEEHHSNLANSWYELNRYRKCIEHCEKFLSYEESGHVKAMMASCHGALGDWQHAATAYRSISNIWFEPSFALGLAEAELQCGNFEEARNIVATVDINHPNPNHDLELSIEYLRNELADRATAE